ncbi:MAG: TetR/AcrR family transcriptional regulator [Acidimicrobiia bacterium]
MSTRRVAAEPARSGAVTGSADGRGAQGRGERTRDRLLAAGAAVFAERGVHAARVDDIVKGARTSHGTFYLYFANKEELFRALAEQVATDLEALAGRLPPLTADAAGLEALRAWMHDFGRLYRTAGPVIRAWTETEIVANDVGRLATTVWGEFTRALIERIRAAGAGDVDPAVAALAIVAMIERANYYEFTDQVEVTPGELPDTLARVTHAAIFGRG